MSSPTRPLPGWSVPLFFIVGAVSQYLGAAIGVFLFETIEPATVAWLRAAAAAAVLVCWRRPWRVRWTRHSLLVTAGFGLVTVCMNVAFYESISRIPLGTAVAIEFAGPVAVAALGSRRMRDGLAVLLVAAGVVLLAGTQTRGQSDVSADVQWVGVALALIAAVMWAGYILLGKRVADTGDGVDSLAVGMALGAAVLAPILVTTQSLRDASVFADPRTWLLGAGIGVLSSAIPYALDQRVLATIGRARFALLLALLPATAAVVGAAVLAQHPSVGEIGGIALVMLALVISARAAPAAQGPAAP